MICVDITNESIDSYKKQLANFNWDDWSEVHFVHGFETHVYADTFFYASYPLESQFSDIEKSVDEILNSLSAQVISYDYQGKIIHNCVFSNSARVALRDYADQNKIDQMVIETRGKHGFESLFSSSFAEYMIGHANCNLLIVRDKK